jgi:hypothetical protein
MKVCVMEDAEIVEHENGWWVVHEVQGQRRYFLTDKQILSTTARPQIGMRGKIGYVQGLASLVQVFIPID